MTATTTAMTAAATGTTTGTAIDATIDATTDDLIGAMTGLRRGSGSGAATTDGMSGATIGAGPMTTAATSAATLVGSHTGAWSPRVSIILRTAEAESVNVRPILRRACLRTAVRHRHRAPVIVTMAVTCSLQSGVASKKRRTVAVRPCSLQVRGAALLRGPRRPRRSLQSCAPSKPHELVVLTSRPVWEVTTPPAAVGAARQPRACSAISSSFVTAAAEMREHSRGRATAQCS
mmetsp:Transcript_21621/g.55229  ORF Transcript_21621/g.55229 Transcript_21621/m.55229 type:complete len:233 (+) Transcript_21621:119-817(+)